MSLYVAFYAKRNKIEGKDRNFTDSFTDSDKHEWTIALKTLLGLRQSKIGESEPEKEELNKILKCIKKQSFHYGTFFGISDK